MFVVHRSSHNPLIQPEQVYPWEHIASCNGCPIRVGSKIHMFYRAIANPDPIVAPGVTMSTIGRAVSSDGIHFHSKEQLIFPEYAWERYGCEDPRVTYLEGTYYIFYTALSVYPFTAAGIKIAVATSKDLKTIDHKHLITPFNAKAMTLFPEKVNGRYVVLFTLHSDSPPSRLAFAYLDSLDDLFSETFWNTWYQNIDKHHYLELNRNDQDHVEIGAPPVLTDRGWILVYSHIQHYFTDNPLFGIEAILLDRDDPSKIISRTKHPLLTPETMYERYGYIQNITFPTGALIHEGNLDIYYGAADTSTARASVNLEQLLDGLDPDCCESHVTRMSDNPLLSPIPEHAWEARDVFNPTAFVLDNEIHVIYRAMSMDNTSVFGYARTRNGVTFDERLDTPIYLPRTRLEQKLSGPEGNSGCEDPRATILDNKLYIAYTAYNGIEVPRVAISHITLDDFRARRWNWSEPHILTPPNIDDKDACILPLKINGQYVIIHRIDSHICLAYLDSIDAPDAQVDRCIGVLSPRRGMWDGAKVGLSGTPILTDAGWLMFYHGVGEDKVYRVGAALLSVLEPGNVLARTSAPLLEPELSWEREGEIPNVVFPCGHVLVGDTIYMYYGGADRVVGGCTMSLEWILDILQ
jgi:predicted GH43/DUF377 family glycosyl hydrolase